MVWFAILPRPFAGASSRALRTQFRNSSGLISPAAEVPGTVRECGHGELGRAVRRLLCAIRRPRHERLLQTSGVLRVECHDEAKFARIV